MKHVLALLRQQEVRVRVAVSMRREVMVAIGDERVEVWVW